jgi:uncharacterized membrane protein
MATVKESVEIAVPVQTAYNQWTQFEEFPKFMKGVEKVQQLDDTHLRWKADVAGQSEEWEAEITEQIPDRRIAWRSTTGPMQSGIVTFQPVDGDKTRVDVEFEWTPQGVAEKAGAAVGADEWRVGADLDRFKEMIEARGAETGAWRGTVSNN